MSRNDDESDVSSESHGSAADNDRSNNDTSEETNAARLKAAIHGLPARYKVGAALGAAALVLSAGGCFIYNNTSQESMQVDQDAIDLYNSQINNASLDYYDVVCSAVSETSDASKEFMRSSVDAVGRDNKETPGVYINALNMAAARLTDARERIDKTDERAPKIVNVNGDTTSYSGATKPLSKSLSDAIDAISEARDSDDWRSDDTTRLSNAARSAMSTVSQSEENVSKSLNSVFDKAPIYSQATLDAVKSDSACASVFGPFAEKQDVVIKGVADFMITLNRSHHAFFEAIGGLQSLSMIEGVPVETTYRVAQESFTDAEKRVSDGLDDFRDWAPTASSDSDEGRAERSVTPSRDSAVKTYDEVHSWLKSVNERLSKINKSDADGLSEFFSSISPEIRDIQVKEAQMNSTARIDTDVRTEATRDLIKKDSPTQVGPVKSLVDLSYRYRDSHKQSTDAFSAFSDATSSSQAGNDLAARKAEIASSLDALIESINASKKPIDGWRNSERDGSAERNAAADASSGSSEQLDALTDVVEWAKSARDKVNALDDRAGERLRPDDIGAFVDGLKSALSGLREKQIAVSDAFADNMKSIMTVSDETTQLVVESK